MLFTENYFYYITVGLQAICVIHCLRKGNQNKWIWIIVFLPLVGCLAYLYSEVLTRRQLQNLSADVSMLLHPKGSIRKLEEQLQFADTFNNRVALADVYLANGQTQKAIALYESSRTGVFAENEHLLTMLILAYYRVQRYTDVISIAKKICHSPQFIRSKAHLLYAMSLHHMGNNEGAEKEFLMITGRFANYEMRYQYGQFLLTNNRTEEAVKIFTEMLREKAHLHFRERRNNQAWFNKANETLKRLGITAS